MVTETRKQFIFLEAASANEIRAMQDNKVVTFKLGSKVDILGFTPNQSYEGFINGSYLNYVFPKTTTATPAPVKSSVTTGTIGSQPPVTAPVTKVSLNDFKPAGDGTVTIVISKDQAYELEKLLDNLRGNTWAKTISTMDIASKQINDSVKDILTKYVIESEQFSDKYLVPVIKQLEQYRGKK